MTKTLPTIKIVWPGDPGWININQSAFDPTVHQEYGKTVDVTATAVAEPAEADAAPTQSRAEREDELEAMHYSKVKALFEDEYQLGDYTNKSAAISLILDHELGAE